MLISIHLCQFIIRDPGYTCTFNTSLTSLTTTVALACVCVCVCRGNLLVNINLASIGLLDFVALNAALSLNTDLEKSGINHSTNDERR